MEAYETLAANQVLPIERWTKLTPATMLQILKDGNREFAEGKLTIRNNNDAIRTYPKIAIVSCSDVSIPIEDLFHRNYRDLIVTNVAGNIINEDILYHLEYACKVSDAKLILVLGHENCGAITSAIKEINQGNSTSILSEIESAVTNINRRFKGNKSTQNINYLTAVCYENVKIGIHTIRQKSPILRNMEANGGIIITGGIYDMELGEVDFLT